MLNQFIDNILRYKMSIITCRFRKHVAILNVFKTRLFVLCALLFMHIFECLHGNRYNICDLDRVYTYEYRVHKIIYLSIIVITSTIIACYTSIVINQATEIFQLMHGFEIFDVFANNRKKYRYYRIILITAKCKCILVCKIVYIFNQKRIMSFTLNVLTLNTRGLNDKIKRRTIFE